MTETRYEIDATGNLFVDGRPAGEVTAPGGEAARRRARLLRRLAVSILALAVVLAVEAVLVPGGRPILTLGAVVYALLAASAFFAVRRAL